MECRGPSDLQYSQPTTLNPTHDYAMSPRPPTVSVIVPCFNLGEYLDEAVASVLAQTFQDFEILVVDDGSTDPNTQQIIAGFERPKTKVFRTANQGLARARNYLIARAQGTYLCALDSDDRLDPTFLEKTISEFNRDPSLTFVSTHLQMFGSETGLWPPEPQCDLPALLSDDTVITAALVRRSAVLEVGGYDENMPSQGDEDWDLWISLVKAGHQGTILPDVLFFYRRRRGSMCDQCTKGTVHLKLFEYLVNKHNDTYRTHLLDVLTSKEIQIRDLRRANVAIEMELDSYLAPTLARRQTELRTLTRTLEQARLEQETRDQATLVAALRRELERSRTEHEALSTEYQRSRDEVLALRSSVSWTLTAPLRAFYDALIQRRSRNSS